MSKRITIKGWQIEFSWQGIRLTPPAQVNRYREIKAEAWMQAADAFVPGGLLLAEVSVRSFREKQITRRRTRRRRIS